MKKKNEARWCYGRLRRQTKTIQVINKDDKINLDILK